MSKDQFLSMYGRGPGDPYGETMWQKYAQGYITIDPNTGTLKGTGTEPKTGEGINTVNGDTIWTRKDGFQYKLVNGKYEPINGAPPLVSDAQIQGNGASSTYGAYTPPTSNDLQGQLKDYDQLAARYNSENLKPYTDTINEGYQQALGRANTTLGDITQNRTDNQNALGTYQTGANNEFTRQEGIASGIYDRGNQSLSSDITAQNAMRFANQQQALQGQSRANARSEDLQRVGLGRLGVLNNATQANLAQSDVAQRGQEQLGNLNQTF